MAQIKLTVSSNFQDASKQMQGFSELTEKELKRIQTALGKIKGQEIDSFIQKNQRAANAVRATRGPVAALATEHAGLRRQIETLIRNGMDPMSDDLKSLRKEYERTSRQIEINTKAMAANEKITKVAGKAFIALGAATGAAGIAVIKGTFDMAKAGDEYAKTARTIGITAEELQELQFVADRSGVSNEALNTAMQKLNKNVGDVRAGSGALTTLLKEQNPELLKQLQTVDSSSEAFDILTGEIGSMSNVADRAALSQAAFGRAGQDLINVATLGATEIASLRDEARDYGLISDQAATDSEALIDAQTNLLAAIGGIRAEMTEKLVPIFTKVIESITLFVTDGEKMRSLLNVILPILGGVAAGLASFLIITKVRPIVKGLSTAMAVLNAVLAANPAILIASAIALVVASIVLLIRNWDQFVVVFQTTIEKISVRAEQFGTAIKTGWVVAFNSIKIAVLELTEIIFDKLMGGINKFLDLAGKLPFIGDKFQILQENVNGFAGELRALKDEAVSSSNTLIATQKAELAAVNESSALKIQAIKDESAARLEALKEQEAQNAELQETLKENIVTDEEEKTEILTEKLIERLAILNDIEAQNRLENEATFQEFLNGRMMQENISGVQRIAFLKKEHARIKSLETLTNKERLDAQTVIERMITEEKKKQHDARIALMRAELSAMGDLFGSMSELVKAFGGENRKAAKYAKALAMAQAGINSALAFTQTIADPTLPWFLKAIKAGAILASGIAQQVNISNTPIPSAQTGTGRMGITVPESSGTNRQDNVAVMAQPGETVNVSPRGQSSGAGTMNAVIMIGKEELFRVINIGIESGDVVISSDNIQGGVAV